MAVKVASNFSTKNQSRVETLAIPAESPANSASPVVTRYCDNGYFESRIPECVVIARKYRKISVAPPVCLIRQARVADIRAKDVCAKLHCELDEFHGPDLETV